MKFPVAILGCLLWLATAAHSQVSFLHQDGNWTVWNTSDRCQAVNRPVIEVNHAPYLSFWLIDEIAEDGLVLEAYFWPGALEAGASTNMVLSGSAAEPLVIPAEVESEYLIRTARVLSRAERAALGAEAFVIVQSDDGSVRMAVDLIRIGSVLQQIAICRGMLERASDN